MEKKNELAKEERTIFIVLAIIVLVAIGVLVTWYFTKDKDLEEKDTVTKDKTVETKKKDTSDLEDSGTSYTPNQTIVVSENVTEETEVQVVNVADEAKTTTAPVKEDYNYKSAYYMINDSVGFGNAEIIDSEGEVVNITNGRVVAVKGYQDYTEGMTGLIELDVTGKYVINADNTVTFMASGVYGILVEENGITYETFVRVYDNTEFNVMANAFVDTVLTELRPIDSYDADKYNEFISAIGEYKNIPENAGNKKEAFNNLVSLYNELLETYNPNVTYGTGVNPADEEKTSEVTYGTGVVPGEATSEVTYGTGVLASEKTAETTYGTGVHPADETPLPVTYGIGGSDNQENQEFTITYGTGIPASSI